MGARQPHTCKAMKLLHLQQEQVCHCDLSAPLTSVSSHLRSITAQSRNAQRRETPLLVPQLCGVIMNDVRNIDTKRSNTEFAIRGRAGHRTGGNQRKRSSRTRRKEVSESHFACVQEYAHRVLTSTQTPCSTNRPQAQVVGVTALTSARVSLNKLFSFRCCKHDASRSGSTDDRLQQAKTYPCKMCNRVFPE